MSETIAPATPAPVLNHDEISALRLRIIRGEEPSIEEMQAVVQTVRATHAKLTTPKEKPEKKQTQKAKREEIAKKAAAVDLTDLMTSELK